MSTITAIILTKNEEEMIEKCLQSVDFCSEIVVVDQGSIDQTVSIAKKYNAKIIENTSPSFAVRRNDGLKKAKNTWVLYVDADERVSQELRKSLQEIVASKNPKSSYRITRRNYYLGNNEWPKKEQFIRFFQKDSLQGWEGELHESPKVTGETGELDGDILHYTHRDLSSMLNKTIVWSEVEAQLRLDADHPKMSWWRFPRVMLQAFFKSYVQEKGWKIGTAGLIESIFQSYSMFITYARLWELQKKNK